MTPLQLICGGGATVLDPGSVHHDAVEIRWMALRFNETLVTGNARLDFTLRIVNQRVLEIGEGLRFEWDARFAEYQRSR
jgi:hypothetical protein